MAMGGNLPYRRLCREFGAAADLQRDGAGAQAGHRRREPLLRHHPDEDAFGVQLAGKHPDVMAEAARIAVEQAGARFVDLNFGCPIDLIVQARLGRRAAEAAGHAWPSIVAAVRAAVAVPLSVKIRLGYSEDRLNVGGPGDALRGRGRRRPGRPRPHARAALPRRARAGN